MKLICLLLIVFISLSISSVSAEVHSGEVDLYIYADAPDATQVSGGSFYDKAPDSTLTFHYEGIATAGYPYWIKIHNANIDKEAAYNWEDIPQNVGGSFTLYNGAVYAGGGSMTINRHDTSVTDVIFYFGEDFVPTVGETFYTVNVGGSILTKYYNEIGYNTFQNNAYAVHNCNMIYSQPIQAQITSIDNLIEYTYRGHFKNEYDINITGSAVSTDITRQGIGAELSASKYTLRDSDGNLNYNEASYLTTNSTINHDNGSYYYYIDIQNYGEVLIYSSITAFTTSVGTIELNQSSYTDPEVIQIDAELTTYDFDNHNYYIIAEMSEDTSTWSLLLGDANDTFVISNVTESRTLDIADEYYEYPILIKAILRDYNKVTGVYSDIAESDEVLYNPPIAYDYTLSGTVIDAGTGAPIEGATVSAVGPITTTDTTSSTGRFTLYLAGGSYTITGSKSGYVSNVNEDIVIACNISLYGIYLTQTSYTNGTMNGIIKDADTGESLQDVHLIFTNATDRIDAYTSVGGYYTATGFEQSTSYDIRAIKSGYYSYNGSVTIAASGGTHKSFDMVQINYSVTPTPTVLATYPDGEGHAWTNDEIITMLRIVVPGVFMMMFIFLLLAVLMGVSGNNGGNGGQGMGMKELWQR